MSQSWHVSRAVLRRELTSYFSSPTGYVFLSLFVFLSAVAAFWQEAFFASNLANLEALNGYFPYLLIFLVPALTMAAWAEERLHGTDELLLTLPAKDLEIVAGKYAAYLAVYSVALLFSLSHVVVLVFLGSPDLGLLFATYVGYWLMGAALIGLGMLASQLTANLTVAYILGALLCAVPVFIEHAGSIVSGGARRLLESLSFIEQFRDFSDGVIALHGVLYFAGFAGAMAYLNIAALGRRHWATGRDAPRLGWHYAARGVALLVAVAGVTVLVGRLGGRLDATAERLHSLSPDTRELIESLAAERPVFVQAYLSPEVPRRYVQARSNVISLLRQFDSRGGGKIHANIIETEPFTAQAREAGERFGIRARPVPPVHQTQGSPDQIFFGLVFSAGGDEFVIPFLDPGLPVEYELMRSIRVVANAERKKIGVLRTGIEMFGGFDFQTRQQTRAWSIVSELEKQYDVVQVPAAADYPADLDVLLAVLPNTLQADGMDRLVEWVEAGNPTLLVVDPLPAFDVSSSPHQVPQSPFQQGQPQRVPTDTKPLMDALGVVWETSSIAWDKYNPHPTFRNLPGEVVFLGAGNGYEGTFNPDDPVTSGLQEAVLLYAGVLKPAEEGEAATEFTPLLRTGTDSGTTSWFRLVQQSMFGTQLATNLPHDPDEESHVVAARVSGAEDDDPVHAIVIADADMLGEQFFELRRQGLEALSFDNVTFLLNAVDRLAGDDSFIALRKRRRAHRTLEAVEAQTRSYEQGRLEETRVAEQEAEDKLKAAQERLNAAVQALQERTDLDAQTKRIMISNQERIENRRLSVARSNIEDEKERLIEAARGDMEAAVRRIQNTYKLLAVALSPVPAFALFLFVSVKRRKREQLGVARHRLVETGKQ
ncbi:MAG: Gldg family protein [Bryobacterales bacterium]|nr:Gldg family protein [Bryobacterales bacterium]